MGRIEWKGILFGGVAALLVCGIYYEGLTGIIPGVAVGLYVYKVTAARVGEKRRAELLEEFRTFLTSMQSTLEAGYSLPNSISASGVECRAVHGNKSVMARVISKLDQRMRLNEPFERAIHMMAEETKLREMTDFADVLLIAGNMGGNMVQIIQRTVERIVEGIELKAEAETKIAAKRLEQGIMTFMPTIIIVFLRLTGNGFLDMLYSGLAGRLIMTAALILTVLADMVGRRIVSGLEI